VEFLDESGDHLPGDIVNYQQLERTWTPRQGFKSLAPKQAVGQYLERPVLHYSIGTKIRPSMLKDFDEFGVNTVDVFPEPPPFQPRMLRAIDNVGHDPDPITRLLASYQKRSILDSVHRGLVSDTQSTSFVPALAEGNNFGITWPKSVIKPPK